MLDMGFKEDVEKIIEGIEENVSAPQIVLFSATMPPWVGNVCKEFMKTPPKYFDFVGDLTNKTSKTVKHLSFYNDKEDINSLIQILKKYRGVNGKAIVFTQTK